jgi:hypothetical protein
VTARDALLTPRAAVQERGQPQEESANPPQLLSVRSQTESIVAAMRTSVIG